MNNTIDKITKMCYNEDILTIQTPQLHPEAFDPYAKPADEIIELNSIYELAHDDNTWAIADDPASLAVIMGHRMHHVLYSDERQLIGGIALSMRTEDVASIDLLAVRPECQRRGYGRVLAVHALRHCLSSGITRVEVEAAPQSQRLFESIGFETQLRHERGFNAMKFDAQDIHKHEANYLLIPHSISI